MLLSGGKKWALREQSLKEDVPMCSCGRGLATSTIGDETCIFGKVGRIPACLRCVEEESFQNEES